MSRRHFLRKAALDVTDAFFGRVGVKVEPRRPRLESVTVPLPELPPHLDGFTVAVLADLHLGPMVSLRRVRQAVDLLVPYRPDLVVVAGDLVSAPEAVFNLPAALGPFTQAYGVLGNWDSIAPTVRQQRTVRMLVNEGVEAAPGLWLAGVDDALLGDPDLDRALEGAPPGAVRLLLAHEPDFADQIRAKHRVALQISGHTHGGQIRLPLLGPLMLPPDGRRYPAGLYRAPHCQVYTSRGLGVVHLPLRLFCPPEVSLLTLRPG